MELPADVLRLSVPGLAISIRNLYCSAGEHLRLIVSTPEMPAEIGSRAFLMASTCSVSMTTLWPIPCGEAAAPDPALPEGVRFLIARPGESRQPALRPSAVGTRTRQRLSGTCLSRVLIVIGKKDLQSIGRLTRSLFSEPLRGGPTSIFLFPRMPTTWLKHEPRPRGLAQGEVCRGYNAATPHWTRRPSRPSCLAHSSRVGDGCDVRSRPEVVLRPDRTTHTVKHLLDLPCQVSSDFCTLDRRQNCKRYVGAGPATISCYKQGVRTTPPE